MFLALETPPFGTSITFILLSFFSYRRKISGLLSVLPSFTQMISRFL